MPIYYTTEEIDFHLDDENKVSKWIESIILKNKKELGEINYIFINDEKILEINQEYLKHDYYTDIITFDYCVGDLVSADIFISIETVESNSYKFETSFQQELMRVIIHGVLHLLGYNDSDEENRQLMRKKENEALSLLQ